MRLEQPRETSEMLMTARPAWHEAPLTRHLERWHADSGMQVALTWLHGDEFSPAYDEFARRYPPGSAGERTAALICGYFEAIGALYAQGLCDDSLFAWLAVAPVWDRIKGYALARRRQDGLPSLWRGFENLAIAHKRALREYST